MTQGVPLVDLDDGDVRQVSRGRDDGLVHRPGPFRRADEQQVARPEALRLGVTGAEGKGQQCQKLFHTATLLSRKQRFYSSSGCWPSWAFHIHSVIFMSVKTAVKEDSSGEQA